MVERSSNRETALLQDALDALSAKLTDGIKTEMDGLRGDVKGLAAELGNLRIDVAVQANQLTRMEGDIGKAHSERTSLRSEVGAYGNVMTTFTSRLDNIDRSLAKLDPAVASLQTDRTMVAGAAKGLSGAWEGGSKIVAAVAGLAALIVVVAGWLSWLWTKTGGGGPSAN